MDMTITAPQHACKCGNDEFRAVRRGRPENYRYEVTCTSCRISRIWTAEQLLSRMKRNRRKASRPLIPVTAATIENPSKVRCTVCHQPLDAHAEWCG